MEPQLPLRSVELGADEWLLLMAYRRCCDRRKAVIRHAANELAGEGESQIERGDVIAFPHHDQK